MQGIQCCNLKCFKVNYKTTNRFNTTNMEKCIEDFNKAKEEMNLWEWEKGGYEALFNSCIKRIERNSITTKKRK